MSQEAHYIIILRFLLQKLMNIANLLIAQLQVKLSKKLNALCIPNCQAISKEILLEEVLVVEKMINSLLYSLSNLLNLWCHLEANTLKSLIISLKTWPVIHFSSITHHNMISLSLMAPKLETSPTNLPTSVLTLSIMIKISPFQSAVLALLKMFLPLDLTSRKIPSLTQLSMVSLIEMIMLNQLVSHHQANIIPKLTLEVSHKASYAILLLMKMIEFWV